MSRDSHANVTRDKRDGFGDVTRESRDHHHTTPHLLFGCAVLWCQWYRPKPSNGYLRALELAMNDHEIDRIADAMNRLRPDWPIRSLRTLLSKPELASRARRDVTVALAWVACESGTATPARVLENGPWWRAAAVEGSLVNRHPKPEDACHTCGREFTGSCCDNPTQRPAPTDRYPEHAARARADLRAILPTPSEETSA